MTYYACMCPACGRWRSICIGAGRLSSYNFKCFNCGKNRAMKRTNEFGLQVKTIMCSSGREAVQRVMEGNSKRLLS